MTFNLVDEIEKNRFLLILLGEKEYQQKLEEIIKSAEETKTHICYVCLSKPYTDVVGELEAMGTNVDDFFFIDVLMSHYKKPEPAKNCVFLLSPTDLGAIKNAINDAIEKNNCSVILFDTISTLLIYQQTDPIVKFTNSIVSEKVQENVKKLFIILKGNDVPMDDVNKLTKDLELFADKKLDLTTGTKMSTK